MKCMGSAEQSLPGDAAIAPRLKRNVRLPMIDDPRTEPLREWNRLARENTENAMVSSMFEAASKASEPIETFATWLLVGTAAVASFLITNADKLLPLVKQSPLCLRIKHSVTTAPARLDSRPVASGYLDRLCTYKTMRPCQAATKGVPNHMKFPGDKIWQMV